MLLLLTSSEAAPAAIVYGGGWAATPSGLPFTVIIDGQLTGNTSGTTTILAASFGMGRPDWFETLSPSSASFTFDGSLSDIIGPISPTFYGGVVTVECNETIWTGSVDSVTEDTDPSGYTVTTITAQDGVSRWAQYQVPDINLTSFDFGGQFSQVFATFGPTIDARPSGRNLATLAAINPLNGSALDWLSQAELDSNAIIAPGGDGSVVIVDRGRFADYGDRVESGYYTSAPASLWRMDEASGNLTDTVGAHTATKVGTPTYHQTGPWNSLGPKGIAFQKADATDEYTVGDFYDLDTKSFTVSAWIKWSGSTSSTSCIMSKVTGGNGWTLSVLTTGRIRFQSFSASSSTTDVQSSSSTVVAGQWQQVTVTGDGSTARLYIDGVFQNSDAIGTIPNSAASLRFGSNQGSTEWFDGSLCMIAIWTGPLSDSVINSLIDVDAITLTGDLAVSSWSKTTDITTTVSRWLFRQPTLTEYIDTSGVTNYGDHSFEVETASGSTSLSTSYSAANRSALAVPRAKVQASFHVKSDAQQPIVSLAPMDIVVDQDGTAWQVMSVQHDITPAVWETTVALSGTVAALTTGESVVAV